MPPIITHIPLTVQSKKQADQIITLPVFIDGYGVIIDRAGWMKFCRQYALLRSAYDQLAHISDELQKGTADGL